MLSSIFNLLKKTKTDNAAAYCSIIVCDYDIKSQNLELVENEKYNYEPSDKNTTGFHPLIYL